MSLGAAFGGGVTDSRNSDGEGQVEKMERMEEVVKRACGGGRGDEGLQKAQRSETVNL